MNPLLLPILLSAIGALDASGNDVKGMKSPQCNLKEEWLDTSENPPMCRPCTSCLEDEKELAPCTETQDRVCSYCEPRYVWSELESFCVPCGCCTGKHQVQPVCLAAGLSKSEACIADGQCTPKASSLSSAEAAVKEPSTNNRTSILVGAVATLGAVGACALFIVALFCIMRHIKKKNASERPMSVSYSPGRPQDKEVAISLEETTDDRTEFSGNTAPSQGRPASFLTSVYAYLWSTHSQQDS